MKNVSAKVDVILASPEFKADLDRQVEQAAAVITGMARGVEHADVAPDPAARIILLAPTKPQGEEEARALGIEPIAIITPRTIDSVRGLIADSIVESSELTAEQRAAMMPDVLPALATSRQAGV